METLYKIARVCSECCSVKRKMFSDGIEFLDEVWANSADEALLSVYEKFDDANYFPQPGGSITDCSGQTVWKPGWTSVDRGDCSYFVMDDE